MAGMWGMAKVLAAGLLAVDALGGVLACGGVAVLAEEFSASEQATKAKRPTQYRFESVNAFIMYPI